METLSAMDRLGIDADMKKINPHELEMIADVLEQAGVQRDQNQRENGQKPVLHFHGFTLLSQWI